MRRLSRIHRLHLLTFLVCSVLTASLAFAESTESFTGPKLPSDWKEQLGPGSAGSIAPTPDGLLLKSENKACAFVARENSADGTDERPLAVSAFVRTQDGGDANLAPGVHFYWDNDNFCSLEVTDTRALRCCWMSDGVFGESSTPPLLRDIKLTHKPFNTEGYVRLVLLTHSIVFYASTNGAHWYRLLDIERKGAAARKGPAKIILGRAYAGNAAEKPTNPGMANNPSGAGTKPQISALIRDTLVSQPAGAGAVAPLELEKKEAWEQTLAAALAAGIPHTWSLLGPLNAEHAAKALEPDVTDKWSGAMKGPDGKPIKVPQPNTWSHPDDDNGSYVDMPTAMNSASGLEWAKTEVTSPVTGEALLWYDSLDPIVIFVNNVQVVNEPERTGYRRHIQKDRRCVPVVLNKGANVIKVRLAALKSDTGFCLRVERNDPEYRIALLEKLLELHPDTKLNPAAADALLEIIRRYEENLQFSQALSACDRAIAAFATDDAARLDAFDAKLRVLELLRDREHLARAADAYLALKPGAEGTLHALRAAVRGEILTGKADAAEARVKKALANAQPDTLSYLFRALAGAYETAGATEPRVKTLEALAANPAADHDDRIDAALEVALQRWNTELRKVVSERIDSTTVKEACAAMEHALGLLPGAKNPMAAGFVTEAAADLKANKFSRALGGYWGALLLATCASDPDAAAHLALSKVYRLTLADADDKKKFADAHAFRAQLQKQLAAEFGDLQWSGPWRFVGFTEDAPAKLSDELGPEKNPNAAEYGGHKWVELDLGSIEGKPNEANSELGVDLTQWQGTPPCTNAYVARDVDVAAGTDTVLRLSSSGPWRAWVDGKLLGENENVGGYRFERDRVPVHLDKGKHRLLLRIDPPTSGKLAFRATFSRESELATSLLLQAACARQFPAAMAERKTDLDHLLTVCEGKTPSAVWTTLAESIARLCVTDSPYMNYQPLLIAAERLKLNGETGAMAQLLQQPLTDLLARGEFTGKDRLVWDLANRVSDALASEGRTFAADNVLRQTLVRYPQILEPFYTALLNRAILRHDVGLPLESAPLYERVIREAFLTGSAQQSALAGLEWVGRYKPERLIFEATNEVVGTLDAVRRQLAAGGAEDLDHAMRNVADVLQSSAGSQVRIDSSPYYTRLVGAREYIRALLASLPEDARQAYRTAVASAASARLKTAADNADPGALESVADSYYYTPAAQLARNLAGNLYFDRGQYAQAASMFQMLVQEQPVEGGPARPVLLAKLAQALSRDGQEQAATRTVDRLKTEFADAALKLGGEPVTGAALADKLRSALKAPQTPRLETGSAPTTTYMGNIRRTGATHGPTPEPATLAWMRRLIPTSVSGGFANIEMSDVLAHPQNYPVCDDKTLYVSALDSLCAYELGTGKSLWTQTWGAGGSPLRAPFTGYPVSCPTLLNGRIYMRALESQKSALRCYSTSGKLKWTTESVPELRNTVWLCDPAPAYNLVFAVYLEPADMNQHGIAAVDAETGRLRWKTPLVAGNTGIHTGTGDYLASVHFGPPAVDGGDVYVTTGLSTVAALNAFTGDVKWLSGYPRLNFADFHTVTYASWGGYDGRLRIASTFCSGPLSPVVFGNTVVVAPKDGTGVFAYDRQNGALRWQLPVLNPRFFVGVSGDNLLLCEDNLLAVNLETGALAWSRELNGQSVYGQPALSGGIVYLPTDRELLRIDATTGLTVDSCPWDDRIGPLANLLVTGDRVVGIGDNALAAYGPKGTVPPTLPIFDARDLAASGKLDQAAGIYSAIITGTSENDADERLDALTEQLRILQKLGKHEPALASLAAFEKAAPDYISSPGGLWQVRKDVFVSSLRARLGEKVAEQPLAETPLSGAIGLAWQIPTDNPRIMRPSDGPGDRAFVRVGDSLECVRLAIDRELLWKSYIGTDALALQAGPSALAIMTSHNILVLDRTTGQVLSTLTPPVIGVPKNAGRGKRQKGKAGAFATYAIDDDHVFAVAGEWLVAWDFRSGAELWRHHLEPGRSASLSAANGLAILVHSKEDAFVSFYENHSGQLRRTLPLGKQGTDNAVAFSPDHQRMALRGNEGLFCIDLVHTERLWHTALTRLDNTFTNPLARQQERNNPLQFDADAVTYSGWDRHDRNGPFVLHRFDPTTGKPIHPTMMRVYSTHINGEYLNITPDRLTRENPPGKEIWRIPLTEPIPVVLQCVMIAGERINLLYTNRQDQFFLRSIDWKSGAILNEQILPGTPIKPNWSTYDLNTAEYGNVLTYTAREGVFAVAGFGTPAPEAAEKLRAELKSGTVPVEHNVDRRSSLYSFERPSVQALLAPANVRLDSDPATWGSGEPFALEAPLEYVPLTVEKFGGANDLSARVLPAWNRDGVVLAVEVTDDVLVSPQPGLEATSGDSIRVIVGSQPAGQTWTDRSELVAVTLAWVSGQSVLTCEAGDTKTAGIAPQGHVSRLPNSKGYRYELLIPWALIRKNPEQRPGTQTQLSLGVAVYDDDGAGVKGALQLGADVTTNCVGPQMLASVELLDISQDKLERYRKVIGLMPDTEDAYRFLELLVQSKSGPNALADSIHELEDFIRAHPSSPNAIPVAARLRLLYERAKDANPQAHIEALLRETKAPSTVAQELNGDELHVWVYPDPKQPPKTILLRFQSALHGWCASAYWGTYHGTWGRENTHERLYMGPLPQPGTWTQLRVPAALLNLHQDAIRSVTLGNFDGVVYYDHLSAIVNGKEAMLISGKLPDKVKVNRNAVRFVDEPKHDGAHSWMFERVRPTELTVEPELTTTDNSNLFSFAAGTVTPPAAPPIEVLRKAAGIIPDTAEGLRLLQQVVNSFSDPKTGAQQAIDELKAFLTANAGGPNDLAVMRMLYDAYARTGTPAEAETACGEIMNDCKLARDVRRAFYAANAPVWTEWNVIGPFLATGERRGLDNVLDPERTVNLAWTVASDFNNKKLAWQKISSKVSKDKKAAFDPYVDLRRYFVIPQRQQEKEVAGIFGYAYAKFNVPTRRQAMMFFGAQEAVSIWVNGKRVVNDRESFPRQDNDAVAIDLRPGENEVLIKVGTFSEKLGFIFRLADLDGRPFPDVKNE